MSSNVVKIRPTVECLAAAESVPEIVEALEKMLADARAGKVRSLAMASEVWMPEEQANGCGSFWYRGEGGNLFTLIGGVSYIHARMVGALP